MNWNNILKPASILIMWCFLGLFTLPHGAWAVQGEGDGRGILQTGNPENAEDKQQAQPQPKQDSTQAPLQSFFHGMFDWIYSTESTSEGQKTSSSTSSSSSQNQQQGQGRRSKS